MIDECEYDKLYVGSVFREELFMYPQAYIDYLVYFHGERDYFECHEVLEEYWKKDQRGERNMYWVGLIQIAVSLYHQRRGNYKGAGRMMKNAIGIVTNNQESVCQLGLDYEELLTVLKERLKEIENHTPYQSLNLPLLDDMLKDKCINLCSLKGHSWGKNSDLSNEYLVHKHVLRDRCGIIAERQKRIEQKR